MPRGVIIHILPAIIIARLCRQPEFAPRPSIADRLFIDDISSARAYASASAYQRSTRHDNFYVMLQLAEMRECGSTSFSPPITALPLSEVQKNRVDSQGRRLMGRHRHASTRSIPLGLEFQMGQRQ